MLIKKLVTFLFVVLTVPPTQAQRLSSHLVLQDSRDSIFLKYSTVHFDRNGQYCFKIERAEGQYLVTSHDTIGPFGFIGSRSSNGGSIQYTFSDKNPTAPYFYKNMSGSSLYGPVIGHIADYQSSNTLNQMALVTTLGDSVYYYANGKLLFAAVKDPQTYYDSHHDWIAFSEHGQSIYYLNKNGQFYLYVNDQLIDSTKFSFTQLAINDRGDYVYAKGTRPTQPIGKYDYLFHIYTRDTVMGYVRTVWNYQLNDNGAYYYSGDDNGPHYIAINNKLVKNIPVPANITLLDKDNYLYVYGNNSLHVNGKNHPTDFEAIMLPTLDRQGHFACIGLKNYYLYKFVNGKREPKPLSKYGVRPTPLHISATGEALVYYETDDSIYVHSDEKLLFTPIPVTGQFEIKKPKDFIGYDHIQGRPEKRHSLYYLQYEQKGYFVYDGKLSTPIMPIKDAYYLEGQVTGNVVSGLFNDDGFFVIQKTGNKKYVVIANNKVVARLDNIDQIIESSCFLDTSSLIFYGIKDHSFYRFNIKL